ncbi:hypothetical protein [Polyangium mundeleinium]|uniref:Uncharacterized protein n=1 Tax=Polyangium mundeleinium TaxID=2995306 RepID=A0ABT5F6C9_9BACT|nr:hypothetical protein [Polyangium mundeleinium]MDC0748646.1 hypothetical protein [Polyangium mundeleinium]
MLHFDRDKRQYRVRGDNGRVRWFPSYCFSDREPPRLVRWRFDHVPGQQVDPTLIEEVVLEFSDGTFRSLHVATPEALRAVLDSNPPGLFLPHLFVVPGLSPEQVDQGLRHLEVQGKLRDASRPIPDKS